MLDDVSCRAMLELEGETTVVLDDVGCRAMLELEEGITVVLDDVGVGVVLDNAGCNVVPEDVYRRVVLDAVCCTGVLVADGVGCVVVDCAVLLLTAEIVSDVRRGPLEDDPTDEVTAFMTDVV